MLNNTVMNSIILSYIIPVYNTARFLPQCLDSLYAQDLPEEDFEVIIVNDGSTDESEMICMDYKAKHLNIKYFYQTNRGQGAARNKGIDVARGIYIMFVDSDDYLIKRRVKPILMKAEENHTELLLHEDVEEKRDGSFVTVNADSKHIEKLYTGTELLLKVMQKHAIWSTLFSTNFLQSHGFHFAEGIKHEDVLFNYLIYPYAERVLQTYEHVYFYRYNANSTDRTNDINKRLVLAKSDFYIASSLKTLSKDSSLPDIVKRLYLRTSNSILVSSFMQMMRGHSPFKTKKEFFEVAKTYNLFPVRGKTRSWRTSWIIPIINFLV